MIYLDHNATTPIATPVAQAMAPFLSGQFGNPSSGYALGMRAKEALEKARDQVAALLNCHPHEILFTSGGTESNNTVIKGIAHRYATKGRHIITTSIEHPAVINPCLFLMHQGYDVTFLPVDNTGMVDPASVEKAIRPETILITVMHANNETGTIEPIRQIGMIARDAGIPFHTDAAQSVGKIPTDVSVLHVDFLSVAGHKIYAPKGVGALYIKSGSDLEPFMHGSGQEFGKRAGTENVMLAVGLGQACMEAAQTMVEEKRRLEGLRDHLHGLLSSGIPGLCLNGHQTKRLPNTLNVSLPGVDGGLLLGNVPELCASTGAACHDRSVALSHVLAAMQVSKEVGRGAVRLTLGHQNTQSEIEQAANMLISSYDKLRASS